VDGHKARKIRVGTFVLLSPKMIQSDPESGLTQLLDRSCQLVSFAEGVAEAPVPLFFLVGRAIFIPPCYKVLDIPGPPRLASTAIFRGWRCTKGDNAWRYFQGVGRRSLSFLRRERYSLRTPPERSQFLRLSPVCFPRLQVPEFCRTVVVWCFISISIASIRTDPIAHLGQGTAPIVANDRL